ncbi:MAG: AbrB/MazE/SpoVT family DNA-binding domain-containing protein [Sulfolobales archaeon]
MYVAMRHVVSVGKRSLAVVLPKAWVSMLGVRTGDRVMLRLNNDGSITLLPMGSKIPVLAGVFARPQHGVTDERLAAKERLMALALGAPETIPGGGLHSDPDLIRILAPLYRGEVLEHEDLVFLVLRYLENACLYLARYIASLDSNTARKIHEIEGKMDLLYYLSYRAGAVELLRNIERELGIDKTIGMLLSISLLKISEDLVDSFDRIAWRIEEAGIVPGETPQLVNEISSVLLTIIHCIKNKCGEEEMSGRYEDIQELRKILQEDMKKSEEHSQVYAEIASILNNLEGLIEISLMRTLANTLSSMADRYRE